MQLNTEVETVAAVLIALDRFHETACAFRCFTTHEVETITLFHDAIHDLQQIINAEWFKDISLEDFLAIEKLRLLGPDTPDANAD